MVVISWLSRFPYVIDLLNQRVGTQRLPYYAADGVLTSGDPKLCRERASLSPIVTAEIIGRACHRSGRGGWRIATQTGTRRDGNGLQVDSGATIGIKRKGAVKSAPSWNSAVPVSGPFYKSIGSGERYFEANRQESGISKPCQ